MSEIGINKQLKELINKIEQRPELFIGKKSVSLLYVFINGFLNGMQIYNPSLENELYKYFSTWIGKKYDESRSLNWAGLILEIEKDEKKACDRFFIEFKEYINEIRNWETKDKIIEYLGRVFSCNIKNSDKIDICNYPNKYAGNYYERNCYQINICEKSDIINQNSECKVILSNVEFTLYIEKDFKNIWMYFSGLIKYITIEELMNSKEHQQLILKLRDAFMR
jgi:hypothetical protein